MNEAIVTEAELPQGQRNTYQKAVAAVKLKNEGFAVELLLSILKDIPCFLDGRKMLRSAEQAINAGKKRMLDTTGMKLGKPKKTLTKDPAAAIVEIEEILKEDPLHVGSNRLLFEACNAASMPLTAAFALETALRGKPDDIKIGHQLAEFLMALDDPKNAIRIYEHILKQDPTDGASRSGVTNANARLSMKSQKWEDGEGGGGSFRSLLKKKDDVKALEDMARIGATKDQMLEQIAHLAPQYEANPNDINIVRKIAELYERMEDWSQALAYYSWGTQIAPGDPTIETKVHKLGDKIEEIHIKTLTDAITANPDDPELQAQVDEMERVRSVRQVATARERVDRNPTDPQLRFELGSHLYNAGLPREAIPELQRAKSNPHIRHKAMLTLAKCYGFGKMFDLAIGQLKEAAAEMPTMDAVKKDIVYEMGVMTESTGDKAEALECFKQIYSVDYGYRDVAARVEGAYTG